jgi:LSD1 subclass zinc finger protein
LLNVDFHAAAKQCEQCHNDPHGGQFANAAKVTPCAGCHITQKWKPSTFDHNTRTTFPLEGAHRNVRCSRCHTLTKMVEERSVLYYKPTPKACAACHGANIPNANPKPIQP